MSVSSLIEAIKSMQIRGAPAIGAAGAMGIALSLIRSLEDGLDEKAIKSKIHSDAVDLVQARPTAVNLSWGVSEALKFIKNLPDGITPEEESRELVQFVKKLADSDVEANKEMGAIGSRLIHDGSTVLTHCN